jgi:hypothetical protein
MKTTRNQYFKCFKCGASGSVFDLLIHSNKASSFSEALTMLRPLVEVAYKRQEKSLNLLDKLWSDLLAQNQAVTIEWLKGRGIPVDRVPTSYLDEFAYWSDDFSKVVIQKYTSKEVQMLEEYQLYPLNRFENRIIFPIKNLNGRVVHFTGRSIDKEEEGPRWLHTKADPPINNYLYQLHTINNQEQDYIILCEGVTDCMSLRALGEPAMACLGVNISLTQHAWALKNKVTHIVVMLDRDKYPLGTPRAGEYKSWSGMVPNLIDLATELRVPIFCCMVPNWSGVKDINNFMNEIDFDLREFKRHLANNSVTLGELALDMYIDKIEEHDALWSLFKHLPDSKAIGKLKQCIESRYTDWTEYILNKAI